MVDNDGFFLFGRSKYQRSWWQHGQNCKKWISDTQTDDPESLGAFLFFHTRIYI